jgi:hypothetical protein
MDRTPLRGQNQSGLDSSLVGATSSPLTSSAAQQAAASWLKFAQSAGLAAQAAVFASPGQGTGFAPSGQGPVGFASPGQSSPAAAYQQSPVEVGTDNGSGPRRGTVFWPVSLEERNNMTRSLNQDIDRHRSAPQGAQGSLGAHGCTPSAGGPSAADPHGMPAEELDGGEAAGRAQATALGAMPRGNTHLFGQGGHTRPPAARWDEASVREDDVASIVSSNNGDSGAAGAGVGGAGMGAQPPVYPGEALAPLAPPPGLIGLQSLPQSQEAARPQGEGPTRELAATEGGGSPSSPSLPLESAYRALRFAGVVNTARLSSKSEANAGLLQANADLSHTNADLSHTNAALEAQVAQLQADLAAEGRAKTAAQGEADRLSAVVGIRASRADELAEEAAGLRRQLAADDERIKVCVCVHVCARARMCVYVRERAREREGERPRRV